MPSGLAWAAITASAETAEGAAAVGRTPHRPLLPLRWDRGWLSSLCLCRAASLGNRLLLLARRAESCVFRPAHVPPLPFLCLYPTVELSPLVPAAGLEMRSAPGSKRNPEAAEE